MKKSVIFLINGLGIEKPGSYSISINQCMPKLSYTQETSYFTTAVIDSIESRSAYEKFFLGDTYRKELDYVQDNVINSNLSVNPTFQAIRTHLSNETTRLHVFLEPTTDQIVEQINSLVKMLSLGDKREVFLHLLLTQQTVGEYRKLISMVNYIKYHLASCITVGFVMGKEYLSEELTKEEMNMAKKMFFFCSAERWTDTDQKFVSLQQSNIRPCVAPGFCATNSCTINNGDVILFFNTRRTTYDKFVHAILDNATDAFRGADYTLPMYSLIQLDTQYQIPCFAQNVVYEESLANLLEKTGKKALIISDEKNLSLINFLANGLSYTNNPNIQFMKNDIGYLSSVDTIRNLLDTSDFDLFIFDFHMDVSKTINDLKNQLFQIDVVLGNVASICANKYSLFITSLYGLKKELPLAEYNSEMVMIDYELQIPIFFFDYTYPRSKYTLFPGETHDILCSALHCICGDGCKIDTLVKPKGVVNYLLGAFTKK